MKSRFYFLITLFSCVFYSIYCIGQDSITVFKCGDKLTDPRDGKIYRTASIGIQCWMAENLNAGVRISMVKDQRENGIIEKYCYDNREENCDVYGGLYQWGEVMQYAKEPGTQGICPPSGNWHVPTDQDWCKLAGHLDSTINCQVWGPTGTNAGAKLKSTGTIKEKTGLWLDTDRNATNASHFDAIPSGTRSIYAKFFYLGYHSYFWTSSDTNNLNAWFYYLKYSNDCIYRESYFKASGYSVRCVRDN